MMYHVAFQPLPESGVTREDIAKANVVRLVKDFVASIPPKFEGMGEHLYKVPNDSVMSGMVKCARLLMTGGALDGVNSEADDFGYEAVEFYDHVMDRVLTVLRPQARARVSPGHWGLYIFSLSSVSSVIVHAPHPVADRHSDLMAAQAFQGGDARALFVAGAHRYAAGRGKTRDLSPADVAHYHQSVFNEIHRESLVQLNPAAVIQFHGYDDAARPPDDMDDDKDDEQDKEPLIFKPPDTKAKVNIVVSSGLTQNEFEAPNKTELTNRLLALEDYVKKELREETEHAPVYPPFDAGKKSAKFLPNVSWVKPLMGSTNQQRKVMRDLDSDVPFLHVEVHKALRYTGGAGKSWRVRATSRLALTVIDAVHKHLGTGRPPIKPFPMLGFDRNEYPGRTPFDAEVTDIDGVMATWIHDPRFGFVGYHLDSERFLKKDIDPAQSWTGRRRRLEMLGWNVKPIYFGNEYDSSPKSVIDPTPKETDLSPEEGNQGKAHAQEAVRLARQEGFAAKTVVYLDVENTYDQDPTKQPNLRRYVRDWLEEFAANEVGYVPGVYCSYLSADQIRKEAPSHKVFWVHNVACSEKGKSPGCQVVSTLPPLKDSGVPYATVWQYAKAPIDHVPDFVGCFPIVEGKAILGSEFGKGYTNEAPKTSDPEGELLKISPGTCWTPLIGTHIQWAAEVDLDVSAQDPINPIFFKIRWFFVPIWIEYSGPASDLSRRVRVRIQGGKIIIEFPPRPPDVLRLDERRFAGRLRAVGEAVVALAAAGLVRFSRQENARTASRSLVALARARFSAAFSAGRRL